PSSDRKTTARADFTIECARLLSFGNRTIDRYDQQYSQRDVVAAPQGQIQAEKALICVQNSSEARTCASKKASSKQAACLSTNSGKGAERHAPSTLGRRLPLQQTRG